MLQPCPDIPILGYKMRPCLPKVLTGYLGEFPNGISERCSWNSLPWPSFFSFPGVLFSFLPLGYNTSTRSNPKDKGVCLSDGSNLEAITIREVTVKSGVKWQLCQKLEAVINHTHSEEQRARMLSIQLASCAVI